MKIGINEAQTYSYQTHLSSPDVMTFGRLVETDNLQRTLVEDYVPGSNRLAYDRHIDPWYFPNGPVTGQCKLPTTSGPVTIPFFRLARHPYLFLNWGGDDDSLAKKAAFEATPWLAGQKIDFRFEQWANESTNPANWTMNEYVLPGGRRTGFPQGLKPGQRIKFNNIDPTKIPLPGGDWTITGKGTGTINLAVGYRSPGAAFPEITFTDGVASAPMVITGPEFYSLRMDIVASDPSNPLHDMRIIMPGSWPADLDSGGRGYEGKTFVQIYAEHADDPEFFLQHPDHIRDLALFTHARQVDAMSTILSRGGEAYHGIVDPSDRALPTFGLGKHEGGLGGSTPWEWLIEVTDLCDQDFWLCTSHEWTDQAIIAFCDAFKAKARPRSRLLVEYSCETWNPLFGEFYAAMILGSAFFNPGVLESLTYDSGTGKATAHKPNHGYVNGDSVQIHDTSEAAYNGTYAISGVTADTFQFTPNSAPSHSPALPTNIGRPGAFKIGRDRTSTVTSLEFRYEENPPDYYTYSGFKVTTPDQVVANGDVVAICNVDGVGVDGFYLADKPPGYAANEFLIALPFQCVHHPVLESFTGFKTYQPIEGREIRVCVVGSPNPSADVIQTSSANNLWSGYRTGTTFKVIQSQFPDDLDRLTAVVAGFQAISTFNSERCEGFLQAFDGHLPPVSEVMLAVATYHEDYSLDHREVFAGDMKPLASLLVSGGVATATIASNPVMFGGPFETDHNWMIDDSITIQNVANSAAHGKYAIASTPTASTFTFLMPGVPDGPLIGFDGPMLAIKDNTRGVQITGVSRSGHDVTYEAPGHPFAFGQQVGIAGTDSSIHEDVFAVKAATPTSFTVEVDCDFDPKLTFPHRGNAFAASVLAIYPAAVSAYIDGTEYNTWIDNLVSVAADYGMTAGLYETGPHYTEQGHAKIAPWVGGAAKASQRTPAMHDVILKSMALHASKGIERYTYYTMTRPWGASGENFGVNEYQGDTRSRKWTGLLAGIEAYGSEHPADGPATRFFLKAPLAHRIDSPGGYGSVGPDGVLGVDTAVTLSDGGAGGTFTPATLAFPAGTTSAQPWTYEPPTFGIVALSASAEPALGSVPVAYSVTLDSDGNPGNATVLVDDDFDRADGPIGNGWTSVAPDRATIVDGRLQIAVTQAAQYSQQATLVHRDEDVRDAQVLFRFIADKVTGDVGVSLRSDGRAGYDKDAYGVNLNDGINRVFIYRWQGQAIDEIFNSGTDEPFIDGREYEVFVRIKGASPIFDITITDTVTGLPIFAKANLSPTGTLPPITTAGKVGLSISGETKPQTFTRATISSLAYATGFSLAGPPAAIVGQASAEFTLAPIGGPVLDDELIVLGSSLGGVTFDPPNPGFLAGAVAPVIFTATATGPGSATITATPDPSLGAPATASITFATESTPVVAPATGVILLANDATTVGQASRVVAILAGGVGLEATAVITLTSAGATFGGSISIAPGSWHGSSTITPTTAGAKTIAGTVAGGNGGMTASPTSTTASNPPATGTFPAADQVLKDVPFGPTGTPIVGTVALPTADQVLAGVGFGAGGNLIVGTVALPLASEVKDGVQFGAGGDAITGTFSLSPTTGSPTAADIVAAINLAGVRLRADGLDTIPDADPGTPAEQDTFPKKMVALWRSEFKGKDKVKGAGNASAIRRYADDEVTVRSTQQVTDDGAGNETVGAAT